MIRHLVAALLLLALLPALAAPAAAGEPPRPATNDYILRAPASEIEAIAGRNGFEVVRLLEASADALGRSVYLVRAPEDVPPAVVLESVRGTEPEVVGIEEVFLASLPESHPGVDLDQRTMAILGSLDDPTEVAFGVDAAGHDRLVWHAFVDQPAAALLRLDEMDDRYPGEATVAIIDTGVDPDNDLLRDVLVPGYDFIRDEHGPASEWNDLLDQRTMAILGQRTMAILGNEEVLELNASTAVVVDGGGEAIDPADVPPAFGHGTMVAGIIHRVAPAARLMPLKAFDGSGHAHLADIVRAVYYAVDRGANVINMSFSLETFSPELMRAINYAARRGVACVAAAGNEGRETIVYPAALGNAIGVAATTYDDYLSPFTNRGADLVTVAAPGQNLVTTYPGGGWALASGTSFAAPWISGGVAVFADKNGTKHAPGKADYYFSSAALSHARPVHGQSGEAAGFGRVDLAEAVDRLEKP